MDKIENDAFSENIIKVDKLNRSVVVRKPNASPAEPPKTYYFDNVFGEDSSQVRSKTSFFFLCFVLSPFIAIYVIRVSYYLIDVKKTAN